MEMRLTRGKRLKRIIFSRLVEKLFLQGTKSRVTRLSAKFIFSTYEKYPDARLFHSREQLWKSFGSTLGNSEWVGFEFGVASGDATRTFMKMPYAAKCVQWNGFDTFLGLPDAWGDLPRGAFSTGGNPPLIQNANIKWHIGLIQETCAGINALSFLDKKFIVLFDFDLYSATNPELKWKIFKDKILHLLNKIMPEETIYIKTKDFFPWIDNDLLYIKHLRDSSYKSYKKNDSEDDPFQCYLECDQCTKIIEKTNINILFIKCLFY
jgi:hypothetical protein